VVIKGAPWDAALLVQLVVFFDPAPDRDYMIRLASKKEKIKYHSVTILTIRLRDCPSSIGAIKRGCAEVEDDDASDRAVACFVTVIGSSLADSSSSSVTSSSLDVPCVSYAVWTSRYLYQADELCSWTADAAAAISSSCDLNTLACCCNCANGGGCGAGCRGGENNKAVAGRVAGMTAGTGGNNEGGAGGGGGDKSSVVYVAIWLPTQFRPYFRGVPLGSGSCNFECRDNHCLVAAAFLPCSALFCVAACSSLRKERVFCCG